MPLLKKCPKCNTYTFKDTCPKCKIPTPTIDPQYKFRERFVKKDYIL